MVRPSRYLLLSLAAALAAGVLLGWLARPALIERLNLHRLVSEDSAEAADAVAWLSEVVDEAGATRLGASESLRDRVIAQLPETSDETLIAISDLLIDAACWTPEAVGLDPILRRLTLLAGSSPARLTAQREELHALSDLADAQTLQHLWMALWNAADPAIRPDLLPEIAAALGPDSAPILQRAVAEPDPVLRARAWLVIGLLNPASGFTADWADEPAEVAAAILWAAVQTNPDVAGPVLAAVDATPWCTPALPWLLARSRDPAALERLLLLQQDGNPAVDLALACSVDPAWRTPPPRLSPAQSAWFGFDGFEYTDPVHRRWLAWRTDEGPANVTAQPVADDGSVWAAVLLTERLHDPYTAHRLAVEWLDDDLADVRRAGLLLAGLLGVERERIEVARQNGATPSERQTARLAGLMLRPDDRSERLAAHRLLDAAETGTTETALQPEDILLALLAAGDADASLRVPESRRLSDPDLLLRRSWLLERFLPEAVAATGPLNPWSEPVADLQMEIVRTAVRLQAFERE